MESKLAAAQSAAQVQETNMDTQLQELKEQKRSLGADRGRLEDQVADLTYTLVPDVPDVVVVPLRSAVPTPFGSPSPHLLPLP